MCVAVTDYEILVHQFEQFILFALMKNLFAERKRKQKQAKKRANVAPAIIKSPRTQQLENQERATASAQKEKERFERLRVKQAADEAEQKQRERDQHEKARCAIEPQAVPNISGPDTPTTLPTPSQRVGPRASAGRALTIRLAPPEFVDVPVYSDLAARMEGVQLPDVHAIENMVRQQREVSVLCAMNDDKGVRTWNSLTMPAVDANSYSQWFEWLHPAKWKDMVALRVPNNAGNFKQLTRNGNYNEVLVPTDSTPVHDATRWPPQLQHEMLSTDSYVVRMTRTDPFPPQPECNGQLTYRSMKLDGLVSEIALTLHAASTGIGPPVYAAVSWPWAAHARDTPQRYGLLMILGRADGDMVRYIDKLRVEHPKESKLSGPSRGLRENAEAAASWLAGLCMQIARSGHINYDMKQGNLLMRQERNTFYMSDFDAIYYRFVPDDAAGLKARFLVNALLLCVHVRSYSNAGFSSSFLMVLAPVLLRLYKEAVVSPETFGRGADWIMAAQISPTYATGTFNHRELASIKNVGKRAGRQLSMMVFEYLLDVSENKNPPPRATEWDGWDTQQSFCAHGYPPLMPQLLRYAFFYSKPIPDEFREVLARVASS